MATNGLGVAFDILGPPPGWATNQTPIPIEPAKVIPRLWRSLWTGVPSRGGDPVNQSEILWKTCEEALRGQVAEGVWLSTFAGISLIELNSEEAVLGAPNKLIRDRVERQWQSLIEDTVATVIGYPVKVSVEVVAGDDLLFEADQAETETGTPEPVQGAGAVGVGTAPTAGFFDSRYTFDTWVAADSNRFAFVAAQSVAENPARSYNPLFIYGDAGLGKTHLLHAIGNYVGENLTRRKVLYVTTETYMNEFVSAIRSNGTDKFKRRYRDECDVLLIDDVQFMEGKESTQEEFFHTFNSLYGASKQIVLTSDRPPSAIPTLSDRLRSRFLSGLTVDIQHPTLETRIAILQMKAEHLNMPVPDEVLDFIASNVTENIRELEGALIRVTAFASLNREELTLSVAERVLSDIVGGGQPRVITPDVILRATSDAFGFSVEDIIGPKRQRPLVAARQVGMYVFRELTEYSFPAIAKVFGDRDHTTVMYAVDKITQLMKERHETYNQVTNLIVAIRNGG